MRLLAAVVLLTGLAGPSTFGQIADGPAFEVATVKPGTRPTAAGGLQGFRGGPGTASPEQISAGYTTLSALLAKAYDFPTDRITGPAWMTTERYDISAKVPAGSSAEQVNRMWQKLLAERLGVRVHLEPKEFSVFELRIGDAAPKLKVTAVDPATIVPGTRNLDSNGQLQGAGLLTTISPTASGQAVRITANAQSMSQLLVPLKNLTTKAVTDKTGLTGLYDFKLEFSRSYSDPAVNQRSVPPAEMLATLPADPGGPDLETAIRQQLGLKLVQAKAMLDVLVVDQAEKVPTSN